MIKNISVTSTQAQCFYMLTVPLIGLTSGGPLILSMGIDRLIAVKFPTRWKRRWKILIMCLTPGTVTFKMNRHFIFVLSWCFQFLMLGYSFFMGFLFEIQILKSNFFRKKIRLNSNTFSQIICANPLALNGTAFQMFTYSSGIIYVAVFIVYLSVYILLKSNKASKLNIFVSINTH